MIDHEKFLISEEYNIEQAIKKIGKNLHGIAFVVDKNEHLIGSLSDGDLRRAYLKHTPLSTPIKKVINPSPKFIYEHEPETKAFEIMNEFKIRFVPVVDKEKRFVSIIVHEDIFIQRQLDNTVVIMCGGFGSRLHDMTKECPKPLLSVGGQPILETIISQLEFYGFRKLVFATNFKSKMIRNYFGNGRKFGVEIDYLYEKKPLGTVGALSLMELTRDFPILVMNGDILTKLNFERLLQYHSEGEYHFTVCVSSYKHRIPYGVLDIDKEHHLVGIFEKPVKTYFVNAGIYVINPEIFKLVPRNKYFDMTDLIEKALEKGYRIGSFPISEYWLDVGQIDDFIKANDDYTVQFVSDDT